MKSHHAGFIAAGCVAISLTLGASDAASSPPASEVAIDCRVSSSNDGCEAIVACPSGTKIRTARAACNLEYGSVPDEQLSSVAQGYIQVVRSSDHTEHGTCWVGNSQVGSGQAMIADIAALTRVSVGCQEYDKNGGDCHIRGSLYCE